MANIYYQSVDEKTPLLTRKMIEDSTHTKLDLILKRLDEQDETIKWMCDTLKQIDHHLNLREKRTTGRILYENQHDIDLNLLKIYDMVRTLVDPRIFIEWEKRLEPMPRIEEFSSDSEKEGKFHRKSKKKQNKYRKSSKK